MSTYHIRIHRHLKPNNCQ